MKSARALVLLVLLLMLLYASSVGEQQEWGEDSRYSGLDGSLGEELGSQYNSTDDDLPGEQSALYGDEGNDSVSADVEEGFGSDSGQEEIKNVISFDLKYFAPFRNENKFLSFILTLEEGAINSSEKIMDVSYKVCTSHLKIDPGDIEHVDECVDKIYNCTVRVTDPAASKFCIVIQDDKLIKEVQNSNYMHTDIVLVNNTVVSMDAFSFKTMLGNTPEELFVYLDSSSALHWNFVKLNTAEMAYYQANPLREEQEKSFVSKLEHKLKSLWEIHKDSTDIAYMMKSLFVKGSPNKGLGVFTTAFVKAHTTIEIAPAIMCPELVGKVLDKTYPDSPHERFNQITWNVLEDYVFPSPIDEFSMVVMGYGMLYNHCPKEQANIQFDIVRKPSSMREPGSPSQLMVRFFTSKDVGANGEFCWDYGPNYFNVRKQF